MNDALLRLLRYRHQELGGDDEVTKIHACSELLERLPGYDVLASARQVALIGPVRLTTMEARGRVSIDGNRS